MTLNNRFGLTIIIIQFDICEQMWSYQITNARLNQVYEKCCKLKMDQHHSTDFMCDVITTRKCTQTKLPCQNSFCVMFLPNLKKNVRQNKSIRSNRIRIMWKNQNQPVHQKKKKPNKKLNETFVSFYFEFVWHRLMLNKSITMSNTQRIIFWIKAKRV